VEVVIYQRLVMTELEVNQPAPRAKFTRIIITANRYSPPYSEWGIQLFDKVDLNLVQNVNICLIGQEWLDLIEYLENKGRIKYHESLTSDLIKFEKCLNMDKRTVKAYSNKSLKLFNLESIDISYLEVKTMVVNRLKELQLS
jgi:hypothetical protein